MGMISHRLHYVDFWDWEFKIKVPKILFLVKILPGLQMTSFLLWPQWPFYLYTNRKKVLPKYSLGPHTFSG